MLPRVGHGIGHNAGIVSGVGGLHFGDVEVSGDLGHEPAVVLLHEGRVLVKDPGVDQLWGATEREKSATCGRMPTYPNLSHQHQPTRFHSIGSRATGEGL